MIRAYHLSIAALAMFAASLAIPATAQDPRLVERLYDPTEVVRIDGRTKVQATIKFADDERIENVAIGDSTAWQVTPNKRANLLFVKPLSPAARTNMTVITDRHTYLFDLVANSKARPLYVLSFTYPVDPVAEAAAAEERARLAAGPAKQANPDELAAAADPFAVIDPALLNFSWTLGGDRSLAPQRFYDDGRATFLSWAASNPVPAILVRDAKGTEGPVNFVVRGDTIVIDGVPPEIVLRLGDDVATLTYAGPVRRLAPPASTLKKEG